MKKGQRCVHYRGRRGVTAAARLALLLAALAMPALWLGCSDAGSGAGPGGASTDYGTDWVYPPQPGAFLFAWWTGGIDLSNDARFDQGQGIWCKVSGDSGCPGPDPYLEGPDCRADVNQPHGGCLIGPIDDGQETHPWMTSGLAGNQVGAVLGGWRTDKNEGMVTVRTAGASAGRTIMGFASAVNAVTAPDTAGNFYVGLSSGHVDMCNAYTGCDDMPIYYGSADVYALVYNTFTGEVWAGRKDGGLVYCSALNATKVDCRYVAYLGGTVTDMVLSPSGNVLAVTQAGTVSTCNAAWGWAQICRSLNVPGLPYGGGSTLFNIETIGDQTSGVLVGISASKDHASFGLSALGDVVGTLYMFPEADPEQVTAYAQGKVGMSGSGPNLASDGWQFFFYAPQPLPGDTGQGWIYGCRPEFVKGCQGFARGDPALQHSVVEETIHTSGIAVVGGTPGSPP